MNGLASASSLSQSLLQPSENSAAGTLDTLGAGSTISDPQPSPQDSSSSIDHLESTAGSNIIANGLSASDTQKFATSSQPEGGLVRTADVIIDRQDKGGAAEKEGAQAEPLVIKEEGEVLLEASVNGQIELLEHTPESGVGAGVGLIVNEEGHEWVPDGDHELKRVKVYELVGSQWMDQGTAFCFGQFSDDGSDALLIARSERNYNDIVLSTVIRSNDVYQRQQETLIVWTEPDGVDYALSFQDPEGCLELWNFIQEVQRHMHASDDPTNINTSPLLGSETSVTTTSIIRSGHLPTPQLGIITEIERAIKTLARTQAVKERICEYIQQEDYIKSLIDVMHMAEDLESLENLHALCSLMQTILMLNDHTMYEHILEDDIFFGVVGMLEYDPDFPGHKANYRDFLHNIAQFHQPIPMRDIAIQRKIHHTYRLQFLKDVVLARALDDSTFNVLNSSIIFNQIDIITHIQQDQCFLRDVVRLFFDEEVQTGGARRIMFQGQQIQPSIHSQPLASSQHMVISLNGNGDNINNKPEPLMEVDQKPAATSSPKPVNGVGTVTAVNGRGGGRSGSCTFQPPDDLTAEDIALRREVIVLLQQLCIMGKNVQMPARMALFRTLVDRGVLFATQWALSLSEKDEANKPMISAAGEVLSALLDHDLNGVRGHVLKQASAIEKDREAGKKGSDKAESMLEMTCRILATSKDLTVQSQMGDALKVWMDIPSLDSIPPGASEAAGPKPLPMIRKDDPGTERYMEYFYKECVNTLLKPLFDLPEWRNFNEPLLPLPREETNRCVYLCDLLHNFLQQHAFRSHFHVMSSDILSRVATLFKAKDKHLRHSAFRIFRLLLKQGNPNSHAQVMKQDILKPILDLTIQESLRDNLLSCSCQEYFEHMRKENIKDMIRFCMTKHESEIQKLAKSPLGEQRFELFIRRYEMNIAPLPVEATPDKSTDDRLWLDASRDAEEDYFNADDDEDDLLPTISQQQQLLRSSPLSGANTGLKRKRRPGISSQPKGYRPPLKTPQLGGPLVDYDDDEDTSLSAPQASGSNSTSPPENKITFNFRSRSASPSPPTPPLNTIPIPTPTSGPPPKRATKEEDEDNILESLVRNTRARSQSPSPNLGPMRPSEKRRRTDEDDEDELFMRLNKSSTKHDLGIQNENAPSIGVRAKNGDDPPAKKIKVKFGAGSLAVASAPQPTATTTTTTTTTPTTSCSTLSEQSKKDGDTG